jgi:hypothetical protein
MVIIAIIVAALTAALIFGPHFWINWVMNTHGKERPEFPGTGADLARHLLDDAGLAQVKVERTMAGDHYSPEDKAVRLSPRNFEGKSVTAIAVAAHEVAHAVQDRDGYRPLLLRQRMAKAGARLQQLGSLLLLAAPLVLLALRSPVAFAVEIAGALLVMGVTVVIHLFTLPTEFDASFRKALPVLASYLLPEDMVAAKSVLRAAAFTYVAGALINFLNILRVFRRF